MKIDIDAFEIYDYLNQEFECDCHRTHSTRLEVVEVCEDVKVKILEFLKNHDYKTIYMIEDENTHRVYGKELEDYLNAQGIVSDHVILGSELVPDERAVFDILVSMNRKYDYILAVGAGTLNDISKFISHKVSLDYGIAATAPSMDGFASIGAALITDNLKTTYNCHVPTAIFADLDVIANAPMDMIKAGLGDIVGKYNCLVDWKIAHMIQGEYYCETIVNMVYKCIDEVVSHADGVLKRDKTAIKAIMEALIETGIAMGFVGNSFPASGSEHHISHYWEMKLLFAHHAPVFHGTKVGLATPGVLSLWKNLREEPIDFELCKERLRAFDQTQWEALVRDRFEGAAEGVIALEKKAHKNNIENAVQRIDQIATHWEEIENIIDQDLPDPETVTDILKSIEAAYRPEQVGIEDTLVKDGVILAKEVRVRYGLLQLLWDLGLLEEYSDKFVEYYKHN